MDCSNGGFNDSAMAANIAQYPVTTPVAQMIFTNNSLTKVPANLTQYSTLTILSLDKNSITSIAADELNLSEGSFIDLSSNQITTIAPGAFPGSFFKYFSFNSFHN